MFAKTIIDSDAFLDMPLSAQALYFHLNMRADDDGFVNNPKRIQRTIGASDDDLKLLVIKRFIICFENGIVVIKHWRMHNSLRKDRYTPTLYQEQFSLLDLKENGSYTERNIISPPELPKASLKAPFISSATVWQPDGNHLSPQDRLGKVSVGKESTEKYNQEDSIGEFSSHTKLNPIHSMQERAFENEDLNEAWEDYIAMRKEIKKPLTETARKRALNKLKSLAEPYNDKERYMLDCLNQSITNCWRGLFEVKDFIDGKAKLPPPPPFDPNASIEERLGLHFD